MTTNASEAYAMNCEFDRSALEAFKRFDVEGKGYLTSRHHVKCAFLALFGTKPSKTQLEVFLKGSGCDEGEDQPSISWQAFRNCVHVGSLSRVCTANGDHFL